MAWDLARILNNSFSFRFSYFILRFLLPWFLCLRCVILFVCVCLRCRFLFVCTWVQCKNVTICTLIPHSCRATSYQEPDPCGSSLGAQPATRLGLHCPRGHRQSQWLRAVAICGKSWNFCHTVTPKFNNTHDSLSSCSLAIGTAASDASIRWTSRIPSIARPRQRIISVCAKISRRVSTIIPASWMRR